MEGSTRLKTVRWQIVLIFFCLFGLMSNSRGEPNLTIGVLYPKLRAPYNQVFVSIVASLREQSSAKIMTYGYDQGDSSETIQKWAETQGLRHLIGLGRGSVALVSPLEARHGIKAVFGGSAFYPQKDPLFSAVSLVPAPHCLLDELVQLQPRVKQVHVVAPDSFLSYLEDAADYANSIGLTLDIHRSGTVQETAQHYKTLLKEMNPKSEAIWLVQAGRGFDKTLLKDVLKKAWQRDLITISNSVAHVKKGILFTCYSEDESHAAQLLKMIISRTSSDSKHQFALADTFRKSINVRTGKHLGLVLERDVMSRFWLVFPAR